MHEILRATAGSSRFLSADLQPVEAVSGNVRQIFEDYLYKFRGAHFANVAKQTTDVIIAPKNSDMRFQRFCRKESICPTYCFIVSSDIMRFCVLS